MFLNINNGGVVLVPIWLEIRLKELGKSKINDLLVIWEPITRFGYIFRDISWGYIIPVKL